MNSPLSERKDSICPACGHGLNSHFRDVTGIARCTVVHSGVTDREIIGIPWSEGCPCADFVMPPKPPSARDLDILERSERLREIVREAHARMKHSTNEES